MLLMHGFSTLHNTHSWPSQKLTSSTVACIEMNVIQWRKDDVSFCGGTGFFKTYESFMLLRAIIVMQK